jgi:hypothetical protein
MPRQYGYARIERVTELPGPTQLRILRGTGQILIGVVIETIVVSFAARSIAILRFDLLARRSSPIHTFPSARLVRHIRAEGACTFAAQGRVDAEL